MIRFIVLIVSIYHINGQAISCSTNPAAECAGYSAIPEVQAASESGICDTEISQCTVTCVNFDICPAASTVVGIPLICTSGICAPPPTLDPTESTTDPSVSPTATTLAPSSTPSKSPVPGTAAPTIGTNPPTSVPSTPPSSSPTARPTCASSGICACASDAPCDAAYTSQVQGFSEMGKCNSDGECTVTCANQADGDSFCGLAGGFLGIEGLACDTSVTPNLCYVPPTVSPTAMPSSSPTSVTSDPTLATVAPSKSPIPGTAAPTIGTNPPTSVPSTPPSSSPTARPTCNANDPICACTDDYPCYQAYLADLDSVGEEGVCNLGIGECTATCGGIAGDAVCGNIGNQLGVPVVCDTDVTPHICVVPQTVSPTKSPSQVPSKDPSQSPSNTPSSRPSSAPSKDGDTAYPTRSPSKSPTDNPSSPPTKSPTGYPTVTPTINPTKFPTTMPSKNPSQNGDTKDPTTSPTSVPSTTPSSSPTARPTCSSSDPICVCTDDYPCAAAFNDKLNDPMVTGETGVCNKRISECTATCGGAFGTLICNQIATDLNLPSVACVDDPVTANRKICAVPPTASPTGYPTKDPSTNPSTKPSRSPLRQDESRPPTRSPITTLSPSDDPSKSPTKSPSDNPSITPTKNPTGNPTSSPSKNPTIDGATANPTKTPSLIPSVSPTVTPVCGLADFTACTCSAADETNCDTLRADSNIQFMTASLSESIVCDTEAGQCTVSCITATTCATLLSLAPEGAFAGELECVAEQCKVVATDAPTNNPSATPSWAPTKLGDTRYPTTSPTPFPTDDDTDCAGDYWPYDSDCSDDAPDGQCGIRLDLSLDVCRLNMVFSKNMIKLILISGVEVVTKPVSLENGICSDGKYVLGSLNVGSNGNNAAMGFIHGNPQSESDCPALDDICDNGNAPGFNLFVQVGLYCVSCDEVKEIGQKLVDEGIKKGDFDSDIKTKIQTMSKTNDPVCVDGFGQVDLQSIAITLIKANGDEVEILVTDITEDGASQMVFMRAMMIVMVVCAFVWF